MHCRKMAPMMKEALARYGDKVALIVMPVPLDKDCNKLITNSSMHHQGACTTARLACGVAKLDPPAFVKFHEFLMAKSDKAKRSSTQKDKDKSDDKEKDLDQPPPMDRVIPKAYGMVDRDQLREFIRAEGKKQVDGYVDLYGKLQAQSKSNTFGLPVQILGDEIVTGSVEKIEDLYKAWEDNLHVSSK
jgi:hypothetical protein